MEAGLFERDDDFAFVMGVVRVGSGGVDVLGGSDTGGVKVVS